MGDYLKERLTGRTNVEFDRIFLIDTCEDDHLAAVGRAFLQEDGRFGQQNGNTIAEGICMGSIKAEAENGFVRIYESNILGSLDVDAENGNIELYETKVGKTAKLSCENGRLFAQALTASEIYTENENGFTALVDLTSKNTIFAESENGNIELSGVEFNVGATLITENGDIRGSVIGEESDFTFNCVSSRGKCNLENGVSQGAKQLNLRSENGDIEISFLSESDSKE